MLWSNEEERLKAAFFKWLRVREQETGESLTDISRLRVDVDKSCLLRRLCDGKDPFPEPPPLAYSAPWYELLEKGKCQISEVSKYSAGDRNHDFDWLNVAQHFWKIESTTDDEGYLCRYSIRTKDASPRWSSTLWKIRVTERMTDRISPWDEVWTIEKINTET